MCRAELRAEPSRVQSQAVCRAEPCAGRVRRHCCVYSYDARFLQRTILWREELNGGLTAVNRRWVPATSDLEQILLTATLFPGGLEMAVVQIKATERSRRTAVEALLPGGWTLRNGMELNFEGIV